MSKLCLYLLSSLLILGWAGQSSPFSSSSSSPTLIAPGIISTQDGEYHPTFDSERQELYFMRRTPGLFDYTIYVSRLTEDGWTPPRAAPFSGQYRDAAPYLSPDGNRIFFDSRRPSPGLAPNSINLWFAQREGDSWAEAQLLKVPSQNSDSEKKDGLDEFGPAVDGSGKLYFYSFRSPVRAGARYTSSPQTYEDLSIESSIPDPSWATFVSYLYISKDGQLAIMEGKGVNGRGTDIYYSRKNKGGKWSACKPIKEVNSPYGEGGPSLTSDGKHLIFTSDRPTGNSQSRNANLYSIAVKHLNLP